MSTGTTTAPSDPNVAQLLTDVGTLQTANDARNIAAGALKDANAAFVQAQADQAAAVTQAQAGVNTAQQNYNTAQAALDQAVASVVGDANTIDKEGSATS